MADDMSLDLEKVNSEVKKLIDQLKQVDKQIEKVTGRSSKFAGLFSSSGGTLGLGNSGSAQFTMNPSFGNIPNGGGAQFSGGNSIASSMAGFFGRHPGIALAGSVGLGVAGTAYGVAPSLTNVLANASGYYDATRASFSGLSRSTINSLTMSMANDKGVTSMLGLAPVAGTMAQRGFVYGQSELTRSGYRNMISEVTNMGDYFGIDNMQAVQSMMQLRGGQMSGNLYKMGIMTRDPATGKDLGLQSVADQLYSRFGYGSNGMNADRISASFQAGTLGAQLSRMGFDQNTQEVLVDMFKAKASGKPYDIGSVTSTQGATSRQGAAGNDNPYNPANAVAYTEAQKTAASEQYAMAGYKDAAQVIMAANRMFTASVDDFGRYVAQLKGFTQGMGMNDTGGALKEGAGSLIGSFLGTSLGGRAGGVIGKVAARGGRAISSAALKTIAKVGGPSALAALSHWGGAGQVGLRVGGKILGKAVPLLGSLLSGYDGYQNAKSGSGWDWGSFGTTVAAGATGGAIAGGIVGAPFFGVGGVAGAAIGGALGALGSAASYGAGYLLGNATGGGSPGAGASVGASGSGGQVAQPITGGRIGTPFGQKGSRWRWKGYHTGVDYPCPTGTPVHAYKAGTVTGQQSGAAYGIHIIIDHGDGTQSLYGHLSRRLVQAGARVEAGQRIGLSGETGNVSGPHLHFEIRKGKNNPVNPMPYLRGAAGIDKGATGNDPSTYSENAGVNSLLSSPGGSPLSVSMTSGVSGNDFSLSGLLGSTALINRLGGGGGQTLGSGSSTTGLSNSTTGGTPTPGTNATPAAGGLIGILQKAGFSGDSLRMAYAIAMRESRGRSNAFNGNAATGDLSYGLFQINMRGKLGPDRRKRYGLHSNNELFDPNTNAHVAWLMSNHGRNWSAWAVNSNAGWKPFYESFPAAARKAGLPGYSEGAWSVKRDHAANIHAGEMIVPAQLAQSMREAMQGVLAGQGSAKTVNVTLKIERASEEEAVRFANTVKKLWENDARIDSMRSS